LPWIEASLATFSSAFLCCSLPCTIVATVDGVNASLGMQGGRGAGVRVWGLWSCLIPVSLHPVLYALSPRTLFCIFNGHLHMQMIVATALKHWAAGCSGVDCALSTLAAMRHFRTDAMSLMASSHCCIFIISFLC
jgi:hypothetical protein